MKKIFIQIAVSADEKKKIDDQAEKENYRNTSEFIRKTLLDRVQAQGEKK